MSRFSQKHRFIIKGHTLRQDNPFDSVYLVMPEGFKTFRAKQWFDLKANHIQYITCSAIKFEGSGEVRYLIWPYGSDAQLQGYWDGSKLHITQMRGIRNLALLCGDGQTLLKTWVPRSMPNQEPIERIFSLTCPSLLCIKIGMLPELGLEPGVRPELPCVFGVPTDISTLPVLV